MDNSNVAMVFVNDKTCEFFISNGFGNIFPDFIDTNNYFYEIRAAQFRIR